MRFHLRVSIILLVPVQIQSQTQALFSTGFQVAFMDLMLTEIVSEEWSHLSTYLFTNLFEARILPI